MRKDPPFDMEFVYSTYILERAEEAGVLVVNKPQSLRDANEKNVHRLVSPVLPAHPGDAGARRGWEPSSTSTGTSSSSRSTAWAGCRSSGCGAGDPNTNVVFETLTRQQTRYAMCQRYIPEIREGDKRVLLIDGEPIDHALARVPASDDARGNLAAGARGVGMALTARMRAIAAEVGPALRERGPDLRGARRDRRLPHRDQRHQPDVHPRESTPRSGWTSRESSWTRIEARLIEAPLAAR